MNGLLDAASSPGAMERTIDAPFGQVPGSVFAGFVAETAEGGDREASKASSISRGQHKDADMQHDASRNQEDNGGGCRKYGNGGQERTEGGH